MKKQIPRPQRRARDDKNKGLDAARAKARVEKLKIEIGTAEAVPFQKYCVGKRA